MESRVSLRDRFARLIADLKEPDYQSSPEFQAAQQWTTTLQPVEEVDYKSRLQAARERYDLSQASEQTIEAKADSLLKFAGTLAIALLTAARLLEPGSDLFWWLFPSTAAFVWTIVCTLFARNPATSPAPFDIKAACEWKSSETQFEVYLLAAYYCAEIGQRHVNDYKSRWLTRGSVGILVGVGLLFSTTLGHRLSA